MQQDKVSLFFLPNSSTTPDPLTRLHLVASEFELRKEHDTGKKNLPDKCYCNLDLVSSDYGIFQMVALPLGGDLSGILYRSCQGFFTCI